MCACISYAKYTCIHAASALVLWDVVCRLFDVVVVYIIHASALVPWDVV